MFYPKQYGFSRKGEAPNLPSLTVDGDLTVGDDLVVGDDVAIGGSLDVVDGITGQRLTFPSDATEDTPASFVTVAGTCYARYMGMTPKVLASILAEVYIHGVAAVAGGGGAALNWAEVGIATGALETFANGVATDLTILAATSIDAEARTAATTIYQKALAIAVPRNTGFWIVVAGSYEVTQMSLRTCPLDVEGKARSRAACKPSANIGVPLAFTGGPGAAFTTPYLRAEAI